MHPIRETAITGHPAPGKSAETSIFAVVVLYKVHPEQSATMRTLQRAAEAAADSPLKLRISVCDNTPGGQDVGPLAAGLRYQAAVDNPGLAAAYNSALATASAEGFQWLLTLDQDTDLPADFLTTLLKYVARYEPNQRIAAIVPHIVDKDRHVSPLRFVGGFLPSILPEDFDGVAKPFTTALNSASLLRVSALREVGGYDERFPLHNSDTSLFHRVGKAGKLIAVAGDLMVHHELAIMDRQDRMTAERYRLLLADERAFWDLHMGFLGRVERLLRLLARSVKDILQGRNKEFHAITLREAWYRLTTRRRSRVRQWKAK
jgi:GT2 family glycosyltransferase